MEQARWVHKIYESMTTFQAGFHEAGEPDNQAVQNPTKIFKRVSVASENLWSGLLIKHRFLTHAKTVNGKYLTVVSNSYFFLLLRRDTQSADNLDRYVEHWMDCATALCSCLQEKEERGSENLIGNAPFFSI